MMENQSCSSRKISRDTQHRSYFRKSKERWRRKTFCLKSPKIESSSCRCTMTLIRREAENKEHCMSNSSSFVAYARRFPKGHWSFFGPGIEETWHGAHIYKPNGSWNHVADLMMVNLRESGHPLFRGTSAFVPRFFETQWEVEDYRYTTTQIQRQQSCYFAYLFPSITSVSTVQLRTGVKNLLNRFQIILHLV